MLDLYRQLDFDNPDGGVWKQGWPITYDEKQWNTTRKLNVFVVPHSHNDPGWLETFEKYYEHKTQRILSNMVTKLSYDKRRKFIWAEISFFKLWWDDQSSDTKKLVKRLIVDGQLEIVGGGWVMPDEAVSHWSAQLTQLTQGHQWLKENLDYIPMSSWAIDPFGLSPTMPYLLKNSGVENLIIQRVHYSVKKYLAKGKNLEFKWRQLWDHNGSTELLTHVMPFYSYDVPHTCGPDPKICCQFDFFRLPKFGLSCPWRVNPQVITDKNVAKRAELLLDQYRKKSQLFKSNVVLAPLGDDFRYSQSTEWDEQYDNYQRLFDYMNNNDNLHVKIQFGTLTDYFNAMKNELKDKELPKLSGDFFTYADRDDHYWSGYYTSRPYHKQLDRVLLSTLRASEILAAVGWANGYHNLIKNSLEKRLVDARQLHALFQHHDGVTGTAKDHVVIDYAKKMIKALNNSNHVLQIAAAHLLQHNKKPSPSFGLNEESKYLIMDEMRSHHTSIGERQTIIFIDNATPEKILIYNSLPRERKKVQSLIISMPFVRVTDRNGQSIECQISPIFISSATLSDSKYELSFLANVPGFGITTYFIYPVQRKALPSTSHIANIQIYNTAIPPNSVPAFERIQILPHTQEFSIGYKPELIATFSKSGFLKSLNIANTTFPVHLEFVKYGTVSAPRPQSGAYLFLPDKPKPDPLYTTNDWAIHVITGPIYSKVYLVLSHVRHTCTLFHSSGADGLGLHIINEVDISKTTNFELAMKFNTDIVSNDEFFTDLNGLNMIRRQRFSKLPIQANYYPLPAAGYIEDKRARLTILTGQPLGAASMGSGQFEIMQDRRLMQDDERGLEQGVTDNLNTKHKFIVILEKKKMSCKSSVPNNPAGMLSVGGHLAAEELLHPTIVMHPHESSSIDLNPYFSPLYTDLPIDISVISFRVFPLPDTTDKGIGVVLHRQPLDTCLGEESTFKRFNISSTGEINLAKFINISEHWTISETSLTFNSVGSTLKSPIIQLCPNQLLSVLFHQTQS
ncbi:hypothetical protein HCN44_007054 [Aphidius gifuensis]|nr:alpha-mannosidase 2-like [Aphidius gifuensis]KAF7988744.1 hypothetical protein HCN44_007054 [Aphidius gifuensis]